MINYNFSSYNVGDLVAVKIDNGTTVNNTYKATVNIASKCNNSAKNGTAKIGAANNELLIPACIFFIFIYLLCLYI